MMDAAVYARYSSENQRATSIDDQVALCREAAERFGYSVNGHVYSDKEISGTTSHRPGYQQLLAAAKAHQLSAIIVESQDRLWRDQAEMHSALKRLRHWGVKVFSVSTGADLTDKSGSLVASVMGWKDEAYTEELKEKTRRGMLGQVKRGYAMGGRAFGYKSEPVFDAEGKVTGSRRVVDPEEAKVVQRIFEMYAAGMGAKAITHTLNAEHVAPPRPRKGRIPLGWTPAAIAGSSVKGLGILNNTAYVGRLVWNKHHNVRDPDTGKRIQVLRPKSE